MGMSSHSSVSHCFSVSLSGARGETDWDSAEDLLCMQLALHNNIGMAILIAYAQLGVVMTCNPCVNEIELVWPRPPILCKRGCKSRLR